MRKLKTRVIEILNEEELWHIVHIVAELMVEIIHYIQHHL